MFIIQVILPHQTTALFNKRKRREKRRAQEHAPVYLPSIERLGVKGDSGRVATLNTADGDFSTQLHPGHGEDRAGVGAGQREDVLLIVLQQTQDS